MVTKIAVQKLCGTKYRKSIGYSKHRYETPIKAVIIYQKLSMLALGTLFCIKSFFYLVNGFQIQIINLIIIFYIFTLFLHCNYSTSSNDDLVLQYSKLYRRKHSKFAKLWSKWSHILIDSNCYACQNFGTKEFSSRRMQQHFIY